MKAMSKKESEDTTKLYAQHFDKELKFDEKNKISDSDFKKLQLFLLKDRKREFNVITPSMHPLIKVGQKITVEPIKDPSSLKIFDIILFRQHGVMICHYVWHFSALKQGEIITRSIAGGIDLPISYDDILGRVTSHKIGLLRRLKISFFSK